jgi:hypothetical protein
MTEGVEAASFRDPSGFVYRDPSGALRRQINAVYAPHYERFTESGLCTDLIKKRLLIPHEARPLDEALTDEAIAVIAPEPLPFLSWPYEWCFSQVKAAALLTLDLHRRAIAKEMVLKDASAFNIQFRGTEPVFIDTLSFACYKEGEAWVAYRQFCEHFLAPLAMMAYDGPDAARLLRVYLDGIPLETVSVWLPWRTWFRPGLLTHVHLLAKAKQRYAGTAPGEAERKQARGRVSRAGMRGLIDNLANIIRRLQLPVSDTAWTAYYDTNTYSGETADEKAAFVEAAVQAAAPRQVWDLGANTGAYSRIAARHAETVIAFDSDWGCVEKLYRAGRKEKDTRILPLILDLSNPSPALGWAHGERASLLDRGPADLVLALALVHHLAIGNNVPFSGIAAFLRRAAKDLVIEFVPKEDPQTQRLLRSREDIFSGYTRAKFEDAFETHFEILKLQPLSGSGRVLYHMRTRGTA